MRSVTMSAAMWWNAIGAPDGVLILDDTGDLKSGVRTVGVQHQYTGTAGRIENAQVSVFCAYATAAGRALIDRAVYLPVSWTDDPDRRAATGVPADIGFATKITLGRRMLTRALDARNRPPRPRRTSSTAAAVTCAGTCNTATWATPSRSRKVTRSMSVATLVMLAAAIPVAVAATEAHRPTEPHLIPLTVIEIRSTPNHCRIACAKDATGQ